MAAARKNMHPTPTSPALYGDRKRVAIVTGGARGIGRAIALRLAKDGLNVAINDLDAAALQKVKVELEQLGAKAITLVGDVTKEEVVEKIVSDTVKELGYVDVMVRSLITQLWDDEIVFLADWDRVSR